MTDDPELPSRVKKLLADWKAGEYETPEVLTKLIGLVQVMEQFTKRNVQAVAQLKVQHRQQSEQIRVLKLEVHTLKTRLDALAPEDEN